MDGVDESRVEDDTQEQFEQAVEEYINLEKVVLDNQLGLCSQGGIPYSGVKGSLRRAVGLFQETFRRGRVRAEDEHNNAELQKLRRRIYTLAKEHPNLAKFSEESKKRIYEIIKNEHQSVQSVAKHR